MQTRNESVVVFLFFKSENKFKMKTVIVFAVFCAVYAVVAGGKNLNSIRLNLFDTYNLFIHLLTISLIHI